jgi:glycine betaine/proline transport system ATP-binding protein
VIVTNGVAPRLLARGAAGGAVPVASIDAATAIGQCFPLLAAHEAILVTEGGAATGMLTREMAFKALARSARVT